jgi:hypothetical protein
MRTVRRMRIRCWGLCNKIVVRNGAGVCMHGSLCSIGQKELLSGRWIGDV